MFEENASVMKLTCIVSSINVTKGEISMFLVGGEHFRLMFAVCTAAYGFFAILL